MIIPISTTVDGNHIKWDNISFSIDEDSYCWDVSLTLKDIDSWSLCTTGSELIIRIGADYYYFIIDSRERSISFGEFSYTAKGRSATAILGEGSIPIYKTWGAVLASDVISEVAGASISTVYNLPDWTIPNGTLEVDGEQPISIITKIATAAGGFVYTDKSGNLVLDKKYNTPPPLYNLLDVTHNISNYDDVYELAETLTTNPKYNVVEVSSDPISDTVSLSISKVTGASIIGTEAIVKVVAFPFQETIELQHSYDNTVTITPDPTNPIHEQLEQETIEIVDGIGRVSNPIYSLDSYDWQMVDLGVLTFNGTEVYAEIKGNSLCNIVYTTEYHLFTVSSIDKVKVQLYITD